MTLPLCQSILIISDLKDIENPNAEQILGFAELLDMVKAKANQIRALQPQNYYKCEGVTRSNDVPEEV